MVDELSEARSKSNPAYNTIGRRAARELKEDDIRTVPYHQTEHFQLTKRFLNHPEKMLEMLLGDPS